MRSAVRVCLGPPHFLTCDTSGGQVDDSDSGAIAQLVERVLCKHEVVGSIPSGSTSSVSERECRAVARSDTIAEIRVSSSRPSRCWFNDIVN